MARSSTPPDSSAADSPTESPVGGAGGVVFDPRGRVLLIRERGGGWVFPKGHIDPGETELDAAVREVAEEAGVEAECPDPDQRWSTEYVNDRGTPRAITWFRLRSDGASPTMREAKFPEGAYVAVGRALEALAYPEDRELLRRILTETDDPATPAAP